jgi:predicted Zn-dependent peptidase
MPSSIKTHEWKNGFRLIYEKPNNNAGVSSIYTICDVGSVHESDDIRGGAHFIEHMCFKGTKKVPKTEDVYIKYDDIGAYMNAFTDKRYTTYRLRVHDDYVHNCIDLMSDMLMNSIFNKTEFKKEEKVVIEESMRSKDDAPTILEDLKESVIYKGSSYEHAIDTISYHKTLFDYNKILELYRAFYRPDRMILSVITNVPFQDVVKMVGGSFYAKTANPKSDAILQTNVIRYSNINQNEPTYTLEKQTNISTIHMNISFRTCNYYSDDKYTLDLLKHLLSGSFGSRLSMLLRDKNGLTYHSTVTTTYYEHAGDFSFYAQLTPSKILKNGTKPGVLPLIIGLLNDLVKHGVTEKELNTAKLNINGKLLITLEQTDSQSLHNSVNYLMESDVSKVTPLNKVYETHLNPVTLDKINAIIRKYLKPSTMNVFIIGPTLPDLREVKRCCESFTSV